MNDTAQRPEPGAAAAVVARLRRELGAERVIHEAEGLRPYECDALTIYRDLPLAVALPRDAAQVRSVLRVCHELDLPVVARGAGTGLCAGSMPHPEGVLLNLAGLDRVLEVDPLARSARVQPGVSNLAISAAAAPSTTVTSGGAVAEVHSGQSHPAESKAAAAQRSAARRRQSCGRQKPPSRSRMPCQSSDSVQPPSSRKATERSRATAAEASAPSPRAASVARAVA